MELSERATPDLIRLVLPGDPSYGSIARTAAMTLGLRAGFDWPTLESLALAVDEAMILLLGMVGEATIVLSFEATPGSLAIEATAEADSGDPDVEYTGVVGRERIAPGPLAGTDEDDDEEATTPAQRFREIVEGTVDDWEIDLDRPALRLRVTRAV